MPDGLFWPFGSEGPLVPFGPSCPIETLRALGTFGPLYAVRPDKDPAGLRDLWSLKSLMAILRPCGSYGPLVLRGLSAPLPCGPQGPMALRNRGPVALKHKGPVALKHIGPAALGCTFLRPDTPGGCLTASLWAWRPNGRQAHKDAVRHPPGVSDLRNVQQHHSSSNGIFNFMVVFAPNRIGIEFYFLWIDFTL